MNKLAALILLPLLGISSANASPTLCPQSAEISQHTLASIFKLEDNYVAYSKFVSADGYDWALLVFADNITEKTPQVLRYAQQQLTTAEGPEFNIPQRIDNRGHKSYVCYYRGDSTTHTQILLVHLHQ
jgi:hypothetical protein